MQSIKVSRQKNQQNLLHKPLDTWVIRMCKWRPLVERRAVTGDNFPAVWVCLTVSAVVGVAKPAHLRCGAKRKTQRLNFWCPTGSIIDLNNRLLKLI